MFDCGKLVCLPDRAERGRDHDHFSAWLPQRIQHGFQRGRVDEFRHQTLGGVRKEGDPMLLQGRSRPHLHGLLRQKITARQVSSLT